MSNNILQAEIETELEKIRNLLDSGELNDVRRSRVANYGEEFAELGKQLTNGTGAEAGIGEKFHQLKESLKTI